MWSVNHINLFPFTQFACLVTMARNLRAERLGESVGFQWLVLRLQSVVLFFESLDLLHKCFVHGVLFHERLQFILQIRIKWISQSMLPDTETLGHNQKCRTAVEPRPTSAQWHNFDMATSNVHGTRLWQQLVRIHRAIGRDPSNNIGPAK